MTTAAIGYSSASRPPPRANRFRRKRAYGAHQSIPHRAGAMCPERWATDKAGDAGGGRWPRLSHEGPQAFVTRTAPPSAKAQICLLCRIEPARPASEAIGSAPAASPPRPPSAGAMAPFRAPGEIAPGARLVTRYPPVPAVIERPSRASRQVPAATADPQQSSPAPHRSRPRHLDATFGPLRRGRGGSGTGSRRQSHRRCGVPAGRDEARGLKEGQASRMTAAASPATWRRHRAPSSISRRFEG